MLCRLSVRRIVHERDDQTEYILRVAGEHTLGSAGQLGVDQKTFSSGTRFLEFLRVLGLPEETIRRADEAAQQPPGALRFVDFARNEQLAFDVLEKAELDLFSD